MTITTRYTHGDTVYQICSGGLIPTVRPLTVICVETKSFNASNAGGFEGPKTEILYRVYSGADDCNLTFMESDLFESKDEVVAEITRRCNLGIEEILKEKK
jgi:hypothetical protein